MAEIDQGSPPPSPSTTTWDGAASPDAAGIVRTFEAAWDEAKKGRKPSLRDFLPAGTDPGRPPAGRVAILLALVRSEFGLRWDGGERPEVEQYRDRYPELDDEALVALIYEEFCLREEDGDAPVPHEYDERFPELADRLRRVFDIHELVGSGGSAAFRATTTPEVPFPESGQTTAGFHLREELGRGSFARVFLAEERQLADRPVALKVSRAGSREPQTLARLQHTHIVPVHSYRTDPATGLHLLCMPFFGRVTLERLLAEPGMKKALTGADVLAALDGIVPTAGGEVVAARSAFARLPFARAIAWWGARMAEALAHAHERGVLHRDIKPSNVLLTADGLPMLLDFNLARDPLAESDGAAMGGTLAYMAPEHLDALADGHDERVDHRADIYSLGVMLFEVLTGGRPFAVPKGADSVADALRRAAEDRRRAVPSIRATHPEIPAALEAVVLKCLAVDPGRRYADATTLAADLEAVSDDAALVHAVEPFVSRTIRWTRRNRWPLALAALVLIAWVFLANAVLGARDDQRRAVNIIGRWLDEGRKLADAGLLDASSVKFADAADLASSVPDYDRQPPLRESHERATYAFREARLAANLFAIADALRYKPPATPGDARNAIRLIDAAVTPLFSGRVLPSDQIPGRGGEVSALRRRLRREVEEVLFVRALLAARVGDRGFGRRPDGAGLITEPAPWLALRVWLGGESTVIPEANSPEPRSAQACLLFGLMAEARGESEAARSWLGRAAKLAPDRPELQTLLARLSAASGHPDEALESARKAAEASRKSMPDDR